MVKKVKGKNHGKSLLIKFGNPVLLGAYETILHSDCLKITVYHCVSLYSWEHPLGLTDILI